MTNLKIIAAATLGAFTTVAPAHAALIDFSGYAVGTTFTAPLQIMGATFASSTDKLMIKNFGGGNSLCAFDGVGCSGTLGITFEPGVSGLSFAYSGDDMAGSAINFQGQGNASFHGFLAGDGDPATTGETFIGFENISFLAISSNDPNGIGLTKIGFNGVGAVPEPATWAMMLLGFGALGAALRRRRATVHFAPQAA